jgi:hypothetical protein
MFRHNRVSQQLVLYLNQLFHFFHYFDVGACRIAGISSASLQLLVALGTGFGTLHVLLLLLDFDLFDSVDRGVYSVLEPVQLLRREDLLARGGSVRGRLAWLGLAGAFVRRRRHLTLRYGLNPLVYDLIKVVLKKRLR